MKRMKCILSLVLVLVILGSVAVPVSASGLPFADVPETHWAYDAIKYLYEHGITAGISETMFGPNLVLNRAQVVTFLYSLAGNPITFYDPGFTDVDPDDYCYDAVCWAAEMGITAGTTATTFTPLRTVTKQETLMFLYRLATHEDYGNPTPSLPDPTRMTSRFGQSGYTYSIATPAYNALNWAVNCGVVEDTLTYFDGYANATRAACADYIHRTACLALSGELVFTINELEEGMNDIDWEGPRHIQELISDYYNDTHYYSELCPIAVEYALRNHNIIYIRTHGTEEGSVNGEGIVTNEDQCLFDHDIEYNSLRNTNLVYVSACYAGDLFCGALKNVGRAETVVGFLNKIWMEREDEEYRGADYFDKRFFYYYLFRGMDAQMSAAYAKTEVFQEFNNFRGTDSFHVYD